MKKLILSFVVVAGPGDSLANEETFKFFEKLATEQPDLIKCMSTNGLLLPKYADRLAELGVNSVTVTINAIDPDIAVDIYSFIKYEGKIYKGYEAVEILIKNQLDGVEKAAANGMVVKVNSVLIPGLNDEHIVEIAKEVKKRGASLMNILPLIPLAKMKHDLAHDERCSREECARVARADKGIALALGKKSESHRHGRIALGACDTHGIILHGDNGFGMYDLKAREIAFFFCRNRLNLGAVADDGKLHVHFGCRRKNALYRFTGGIIAAHYVNYNSHILPRHRSAAPFH